MDKAICCRTDGCTRYQGCEGECSVQYLQNTEPVEIPVDLTIVEQKPLALRSEHEVAIKQTEALSTLATATKQIADFVTGGGLTQVLSGYARSQAVKDILGGLATHDGRNSLDARVLGQNALEITEAVEAVFKKYAERLAEQGAEPRDPEIHKPAEEYKPLREREERQETK